MNKWSRSLWTETTCLRLGKYRRLQGSRLPSNSSYSFPTPAFVCLSSKMNNSLSWNIFKQQKVCLIEMWSAQENSNKPATRLRQQNNINESLGEPCASMTLRRSTLIDPTGSWLRTTNASDSQHPPQQRRQRDVLVGAFKWTWAVSSRSRLF